MERPFSHQTKQSRERHLGPSGKVRIKRSGPPNCRNQILRRLEGRIDLRQKQPQCHPQVSWESSVVDLSISQKERNVGELEASQQATEQTRATSKSLRKVRKPTSQLRFSFQNVKSTRRIDQMRDASLQPTRRVSCTTHEPLSSHPPSRTPLDVA